ncbi:hypothetical protein C8R43DRAFT_1137513 [Mycena crocata]|nr:hypothetical protein C8R43DRAFT_1137513 [Mycena crocata]
MAVQLQVQGCVTKPSIDTVHVSNINLPSACTSPTRLRTSIIDIRRNVKCFNQGWERVLSRERLTLEPSRLSLALQALIFQREYIIVKHSFNFPLDFGRSGISAQCGNIEYTTYRRPASGLECSKTSETPLEANAPLHFQRAVCNLPLPDALAFNCRGAAAACDDSLPRSSLASEFAPRRNNSRPVLPAWGVARRDFILRSLAPRVPARRAIKSAFADSAFVDLTQAVNQHNRDALDFLAESTVLLRVHALPALCAIRVSHTPTLPPCKPACAPVCRQD